MDKYTQFDHKVFFVPDIYVVDDSDKTYHVGYSDKQTDNIVYDAWAGRILPNQTVGQAIEQELRETLSYDGDFVVQTFQEIDPIPDNHNRLTPRYVITLVLDKKLHEGLEVFGHEIVLQEEPEQEKDTFENNSETNGLLKDSEIKAILEEYDLLDEDYDTKDDIFEALDEIANDWLLNDLSGAEMEDLAETNPEKRREATNASAVKSKIYKIQLKMQELKPEYEPSIYEPMKVSDWNPPRDASIEDFYKEFAYYFGDDKSKIDEAANLYTKFHPEAEIEEVKSTMLRFES
jgi:hypothetical protein